MQYELLQFLRCPVSKTELKFELISEFRREYRGTAIPEIKEGILFSEAGFVFPIIDGIPRMLIESFSDYSSFLEHHLPDFKKIREHIESKHSGLINYCTSKNKKTKESFELEWSFLNASSNDRLWHRNTSETLNIIESETGKTAEFFHGRKVIDAGCGHGIMTSAMGEVSELSVGIEISKAVENAYKNNYCPKAWYIQGDLQFLPFADATFDLLYCGGVLHHTNNTELSFSLIEPVIKEGGRICLWLYHPQKNFVHNVLLLLRHITKRLPLKVAFVFLHIFIFPFSFIIKKIKRPNPPNYREEIIDLLDQFTPEFRFEIPHDLAATWLHRRKYINVKITTIDNFGFSIVGDKSV